MIAGATYWFRRRPSTVKLLTKACASVNLGMVQAVCCLTVRPILGLSEICVLSPHAWSEAELVEFFSQSSEALPTLSFYDKISSWLKPGVYPSVVDFKETLTGGQLYNGEPNDFVLV